MAVGTIQNYRQVTTKRSDPFYPICVIALLLSTAFQKVALPGTGQGLPIGTVLIPFMLFYSWFLGIISIDRKSVLLFVLFLMSGFISIIVNAREEAVSYASLALVTVVQVGLIFRTPGSSSNGDKVQKFYSDLLFGLSIIGVCQFLLQFLVGPELPFFVDYYLPNELRLSTFNNLSPLYFGSSIFKSNGVFFAEPSFFSQFVAVAAIIELAAKQRFIRLTVYFAAIFCSYSGTGLICLLIFGGFWLFKKGQVASLVACLIMIGFVIVFGDFLEITAISDRINEFSTPNSSGHARFVSMFYLIDQFSFRDFATSIFGVGPGTINSYFDKMPFIMFDPTWGKLLFEYGLVGTFTYTFFLMNSSASINNPLFLPISITYLFFGGYLTNMSVVSLLLVLVVYKSDNY